MPRSELSPSLARQLRRRLTPQEVKMWNWLREGPVLQGYHFRRQVRIGHFIVDFACLPAKLVIEIDGGHHGVPKKLAADTARDVCLSDKGYRVLRFWNHEVDFSKDVVMDTIFAALQDPAWRQS